VSAAPDAKPVETVIDLGRVREELDRRTERAEVPATLVARLDSGAGEAEVVEMEVVGVIDAVDSVDLVVAFDGADGGAAVNGAQPHEQEAPLTPPPLAEDVLRAAVASAASAGRSPVAVLAETSGLTGDALARALGAALHYPVLESAALMALAPAFDLLGPADAARRGCVIVRRGAEHLAVIGNPFDLALRAWLELKIPQSLSWHLAAPDEIKAYIARLEQDLRAMDVAAVARDGEKLVDADIENLSLATISADSSPVVKLVHSTVYDALKAGASDIHLETRPP
jgi:general secretion pathway protein E